MNILVIDASTEIEMTAVFSDGIVSESIKKVNNSHSVTLFESISSSLSGAGIRVRDVGLIGVGTGPGSFTGIRIAVSAARMMAQVLNVPLVGIKTHLFFAHSVPAQQDDYILVAFDAKKERVFGALYKKNLSGIEEIVQPGDYPIRHLSGKTCGGKTVSTGDGAFKYREILNSDLKSHSHIENFLPDGKTACCIVKTVYESSPEDFNDFGNTVPFYARKSDAEVLKNRL